MTEDPPNAGAYARLAAERGVGVRRLEVVAARWGVPVDDVAAAILALPHNHAATAERIRRELREAPSFAAFKHATGLEVREDRGGYAMLDHSPKGVP
jgi:hypothetical protein